MDFSSFIWLCTNKVYTSDNGFLKKSIIIFGGFSSFKKKFFNGFSFLSVYIEKNLKNFKTTDSIFIDKTSAAVEGAL